MNEILTTVSKSNAVSAVIKVNQVQRDIIMVTEHDSTSVINAAYRKLYGVTERIKTLKELELITDETYKSMMYDQGKLEEKLNSISGKRKARQWSGNSRQALKK